jgi:aspartyl protease family protein
MSQRVWGAIYLIVGWCLFLALLAVIYLKILPSKEPILVHNAQADSLQLERALDGHFWLRGYSSGVAIEFMLDTGATTTALTMRVAEQLQLKLERPLQVETADGSATGYMAVLPELRFAGLILYKVPVVVLPNLEHEALLGMNVLKQFEMVQEGNLLQLRFLQKPR